MTPFCAAIPKSTISLPLLSYAAITRRYFSADSDMDALVRAERTSGAFGARTSYCPPALSGMSRPNTWLSSKVSRVLIKCPQ
jgi:hypothetical protein